MLKNVSQKNNISLDNICYLISKDTETLCYCAELSTTASEFFRAGQQGLKPSCTLVVDSESYNGERKVKYNDKMYRVYRPYGRFDGFTELNLTQSRG